MPTDILESQNFKMGYASNIPGDMGIIVIGLNKTLMNLIATPFFVRVGIWNGTQKIIDVCKHFLLEGKIGERIGKHRKEPLYWTGALRKSVRSRMYGNVMNAGGTITGRLSAGSSKVWYAYKVHEIGRGRGYWSYGVNLFERIFARKKQVKVTARGGFRHKPIPYMRIAWHRARPSAVPIMTQEIYNNLSRMGVLGYA